MAAESECRQQRVQMLSDREEGGEYWRDSEADWGKAGGNKDSSEKAMGKVRDEGTREYREKTGNIDKG